MRRRDFIAFVGSAAAAWPLAARAQLPDRARRIGVLMELAASDAQAQSNIAALRRGLHTLGWLDGTNLEVDYRWAPDDPVLLWKFAKELVQLRPNVIVAGSSPVVSTLLGETRNIPIVFVSISDPIGEGFAASYLGTSPQRSRALDSYSTPRRLLEADRIFCVQSMLLRQPSK
jgi:putative ABC transport system substrate-binding protein